MLKKKDFFDKMPIGGEIMSDKKNVKNGDFKNSENNFKKKSNQEFSKDYTDVLNKILLCLYAIILILIINTMVLILKDAKWGSGKAEDEIGSETNAADYDVSMFTRVTSDSLKEATASDEAKIVYIGRATCGYCVTFLPVLQQAQKDYGYETLYLDITTVTTTEQQNQILELDNEEGFLNENFGGTPMVLLMKNSEIVDTWLGAAEYSEYAAWLEENGFAKK